VRLLKIPDEEGRPIRTCAMCGDRRYVTEEIAGPHLCGACAHNLTLPPNFRRQEYTAADYFIRQQMGLDD
jgi:hypothetical protein